MRNQQKHLALIGPVNDEMVKHVIRSTPMLNKNANIILNTPGGDLYAGLAIYDWIRQESSNSYIIGTGAVMSAGMFILQAAQYRVATPNAQFLIHYGEENITSLPEVRHAKDMSDLTIEILTERSHLTRRQILKFYEKETYFDAIKALEYGLIDDIVGLEDE